MLMSELSRAPSTQKLILQPSHGARQRLQMVADLSTFGKYVCDHRLGGPRSFSQSLSISTLRMAVLRLRLNSVALHGNDLQQIEDLSSHGIALQSAEEPDDQGRWTKASGDLRSTQTARRRTRGESWTHYVLEVPNVSEISAVC